MKAITSVSPDSPPRLTFSVTVSQLNIPGHPSVEYTVELDRVGTLVGDPTNVDYVARTEERGVVAREQNVGALLDALLKLED